MKDLGTCCWRISQSTRAGTTADFLYLLQRAWQSLASLVEMVCTTPFTCFCGGPRKCLPASRTISRPLAFLGLPFTATARQACYTVIFRCDPSGEGSMALTRYHAPGTEAMSK